MKRVHVPEIEDQAWFPSWLRTCLTNLIVVFGRMIGGTEVLFALVSRVLKEERIDRIVDLGSGGGGPMPEILSSIREDAQTADATLTMTDLYPNLDALDRFNREDEPHIRYLRDPVDASDLASAPPGLKTMVNCFHHMRPDRARAILESAQAHRQPLLIYEMADNNIPFVVWLLALPLSLSLVGLSVFFLTPFVRPLTVRQLLFTYVIPIIPVFYAWDGQASMPRIYTLDDLDELLEGLGSPDYRWKKGHAKTRKGRNQGTYLLGLPR
jgi:hypothetical protein